MEDNELNLMMKYNTTDWILGNDRVVKGPAVHLCTLAPAGYFWRRRIKPSKDNAK